MRRGILAILALLSLHPTAIVAARTEEKAATPPSVEQLATKARESVVVITTVGRDGRTQGLGAGFVVGDGLIATNLHVIGEARPVQVRLANGQRCEVIAVHAFDRGHDLAVLRVKASGLKPLPLGNSDELRQGQPVAALGNPHGLAHSIVTGVVSGTREVDGRTMIQIAIPIERGNSGGPLLDLQGRVQGIPTIKSLVTANLGFAVPINALKPLLQKPNPMPMERWLTIGALDPADWKPLLGGTWRQRAGRILAEGAGSGFGGRSLCLWQRPVPELPFELTVTVKLDDESGAAGLAFQADGGDRHYGFYPSNGKLRLTRFEGPDVFSWKVVDERPSPAYRPGEWNRLRVRIEKGRLCCYVNDDLVVEAADSGLGNGQVGLAKFRDTRPEFKGFQVGTALAEGRPGKELADRIGKLAREVSLDGPPSPELMKSLRENGAGGLSVLRARALQLERQAGRLRELGTLAYQQSVQADLVKALTGKDENLDLTHASLLVARLDNDELDVSAYRKEVERMGQELARGLPKQADDTAKLAALKKFLFEERGYHGSRSDYYSRSNSYLNEVIDDREGIPLTLSVLYMELARRIGVKVVGVGLPGHFVVKHIAANGKEQLLDVFEGAVALSREQADQRVRGTTGRPLRDEHLAAVGKRAIVLRMLQNLLGIARESRDLRGMQTYLDTMLAVEPSQGPERWLRAMVHYQLGNRTEALADVDWLLEHQPEGVEVPRVEELRRLLIRPGR
jgi:regulator of sirC expression with transglutaminase-like and TPR domain